MRTVTCRDCGVETSDFDSYLRCGDLLDCRRRSEKWQSERLGAELAAEKEAHAETKLGQRNLRGELTKCSRWAVAWKQAAKDTRVLLWHAEGTRDKLVAEVRQCREHSAYAAAGYDTVWVDKERREGELSLIRQLVAALRWHPDRGSLDPDESKRIALVLRSTALEAARRAGFG